MTALNPSSAAPLSQARSLLAPGELDLPARGLSSAVVAPGISSPGGHGNAPAGSPRQPAHPFSSSQHQPMHNLRGCRSERNKTIAVRVGNDADLRAGRLHPLSPDRPVLRFLAALVALVLGRHSLLPSPSRRFPCLKVVSAKPTMARELLHGLQREFEN